MVDSIQSNIEGAHHSTQQAARDVGKVCHMYQLQGLNFDIHTLLGKCNKGSNYSLDWGRRWDFGWWPCWSPYRSKSRSSPDSSWWRLFGL